MKEICGEEEVVEWFFECLYIYFLVEEWERGGKEGGKRVFFWVMERLGCFRGGESVVC